MNRAHDPPIPAAAMGVLEKIVTAGGDVHCLLKWVELRGFEPLYKTALSWVNRDFHLREITRMYVG